MFIVSVIFNIQEGKVAELSKIIKEDSDMVQDFDGCIRFDIYKDSETQNKYFLYEEWKTEGDFTSYKESEKFKIFSSKLFSMMEGRPKSTYYSADIVMQS